MVESVTAGQKAKQAFDDDSKYCAYEVGLDVSKDIESQVRLCIENHKDHFDTEALCVAMLIAKYSLFINKM